MGGDFRAGSTIEGETGSETSWMMPGRDNWFDSSRVKGHRSGRLLKYDPLFSCDALVAEELRCLEGERLRVEMASDKAYEASSAVSSLTS